MNLIRIERETAAELEATAFRYEEAAAGLSARFLREMRTRLAHVLEAPECFPRFGDV